LDELELLRRENPDTESGFFAKHASEPFFVKNLENVQGDERDVIFISVGYSRNHQGYMAMRFGPLSAEGGERRLNVLISRAKKRCDVFSSIKAEDIDLSRASGRGVAAFKAFLQFAETGRFAVAAPSGREEDSPFEAAVRKALEAHGHEVHSQVGLAGFFVDLAVLDREKGGRYILAVECDGATYHSSKSARDRDRLRQAVLEDHGWIVHRIWSTDWFQRPKEQLLKLLAAIEKAKATIREFEESSAPAVTATVTAEAEDIEREAILHLERNDLSHLAVPYSEARFPVPAGKEPHELAPRELADIVHRIVELEGPIHEDEVVIRVRDLWGFARAGSRIQEAVAKAIRSILVAKRCVRVESFLMLPNSSPKVRNREAVRSSTLRKPGMLPPPELQSAILAVVDAAHGITTDELPVAVSQLFGLKSASGQFKSVLEAQKALLLKTGTLELNEQVLRRGGAPTTSPVG